MIETTANTPKPLVNNALVRGHLLTIVERLTASSDEHAAHVCEALAVVLDAKQGVEL